MPTYVTVNPRCGRCGEPETRCASLAGCCGDCTHFADLDADGNTVDKPIGRPPAPRLARPINLSAVRLARIARVREQWEREQQEEHA